MTRASVTARTSTSACAWASFRPAARAVRATVLERRKLNRMSTAVISFAPISTPP